MKKIISTAFYLHLLVNSLTIGAYQVSASRFYSPRPKTLRRIAKNLSLARAIECVHTHSLFDEKQKDLLKALPTFISNYFIKSSTVKTKSGATYALPELIVQLKKLEEILCTIQQDASFASSNMVNKVLGAIQELLPDLEKIT